MDFRHGDIPIYKTGKVSGTILPHNGSFTIAEGEATGHNHVITAPRLEDMEIRDAGDGGYFVTLKCEGILTHPEHGTLTIPAGAYRTGKEREMDWFSLSTRRVID